MKVKEYLAPATQFKHNGNEMVVFEHNGIKYVIDTVTKTLYDSYIFTAPCYIPKQQLLSGQRLKHNGKEYMICLVCSIYSLVNLDTGVGDFNFTHFTDLVRAVQEWEI